MVSTSARNAGGPWFDSRSRHDANSVCLCVCIYGGSSLTNEKDHHYFLNRFVCVGEFFDG